jgi:pyroglutamyl-peptidase
VKVELAAREILFTPSRRTAKPDGMAHPRLLLTGFGPFPGVAENSSAWLVEALVATHPSSRLGCRLHAEVLPTEWAEVKTIGPRLLGQHQPRLILHFGLSKRAKGFRIERSARNVIDLRKDARGVMPCTRNVLDLGLARLDSRVPTARLAKYLRTRELPAVASRSAGTYLCNFLYYLSLDWALGQKAPCDVCFVHVPPGPHQGGPLSQRDLLCGAEHILRYLLAYAAALDGAKASAEIGTGVPVAEPMPHGGRSL